MVRPGDLGRACRRSHDTEKAPLQPAAVRRHRRRADRQRPRRSSSAATSGAASAARWSVTSPEAFGDGRADAGRRASGPRSRTISASHRRTRSASATTWCAGRRTTRAAACSCRAPGSSGTTTSTRVARHVHDRRLDSGSERSARPVLALLPTAAPRSATACRFSAPATRHRRRIRLRHLGRAARRRRATSRTPLSLWTGNHSIKTGGVVDLRRDRRSCYQPLQNGVYRFTGLAGGRRRTRSSSRSRSRSCPRRTLMFPKAYVLSSFVQDDWRVQQQPDAQPRPPLRRRDHQGHSRLAGRRPTRTTSIRASASRGTRTAIRSGRSAAASARFTQQHPIFTIVKGGVGGRNGR